MNKLAMPDADVLFYENFFSETDSNNYFKKLRESILWQQQELKMFGKNIALPRLTAWYGDEGKPYRYSGITHQPHSWTPELLEIKAKIEEVADLEFNSVLLNLYRDENDSVGWHSDDEAELGENPVITSISFGDVRQFQFKHKTDNTQRLSINLSSGSLLLMRGTTQHHWKHRIPKTKQSKSERMNLTFRVIHKL
ncbi:MAG: alpha-ketoglutarate-dependent dioxygenase AlkB [Phototrophicaceae bacterium]